RPAPDFPTSSACWLAAGAAHHTVMSTAVGVDVFRDFAEMSDTELLVIDDTTTVRSFRDELRWNHAYQRLARGLGPQAAGPPSRRNPTPRTATTFSCTPTLSSFWRSRPMVTSRVLVEPYQFSSQTSAISRVRETTLSLLATRTLRTSNSLPVSGTSSSPEKTRRAATSIRSPPSLAVSAVAPLLLVRRSRARTRAWSSARPNGLAM